MNVAEVLLGGGDLGCTLRGVAFFRTWTAYRPPAGGAGAFGAPPNAPPSGAANAGGFGNMGFGQQAVARPVFGGESLCLHRLGLPCKWPSPRNQAAPAWPAGAKVGILPSVFGYKGMCVSRPEMIPSCIGSALGDAFRAGACVALTAYLCIA